MCKSGLLKQWYKVTGSGTWDSLKSTWYISNDLNNTYAYFLYYNVNKSCCGHPKYTLRDDLSWHQIMLGMSTAQSMP